uniref:Uncharacterized protein n=1 Tax=Anguilla anguilla TaxID=7936 RepID=A0A0E9Q445_ANGAN
MVFIHYIMLKTRIPLPSGPQFLFNSKKSLGRVAIAS